MRIYPDTRQITALIHYCQIQYQTLNMNFRCRKQHDDDWGNTSWGNIMWMQLSRRNHHPSGKLLCWMLELGIRMSWKYLVGYFFNLSYKIKCHEFISYDFQLQKQLCNRKCLFVSLFVHVSSKPPSFFNPHTLSFILRLLSFSACYFVYFIPMNLISCRMNNHYCENFLLFWRVLWLFCFQKYWSLDKKSCIKSYTWCIEHITK